MMDNLKSPIVFIITLIFLFVETKSGLTNERFKFSGVPSVIDGDTISIGSQRLRLHGIDSPELDQFCLDLKLEKWSCGQRAKDALKNKIDGQSITCTGKKVDRYRRVIVTCYLGNTDINDWLVLKGWGVAYRKYSKDYIHSEIRARTKKSGVWSGHFVMPWEWRRGIRFTTQRKQFDRKCCKVCRNSKACGNTCISSSFNCSKPAGCACNEK